MRTSISSTFSSGISGGGQPNSSFVNDGRRTIVRQPRPGSNYIDQLDASAVLTEDDESFFFKHDLVVGGSYVANARTQLTVAITNEGGTAESLRFDSLIIPGHLALRRPFADGDFRTSAFVNFEVRLDGSPIYSLVQGFASLSPVPLDPEFAALNDLRQYVEIENELLVFDWWYSPINLELGVFAPGETKTLVYDLFTVASANPAFAASDRHPECPYAQLSFGDPRARGGTTTSSFSAAADSLPRNRVITPNDLAVPDDGGCARPNPALPALFDPALFSFSIVRSGSPLPPTPIPPPPIDYLATPAPPALALFGLGALGLGLRRRRP